MSRTRLVILYFGESLPSNEILGETIQEVLEERINPNVINGLLEAAALGNADEVDDLPLIVYARERPPLMQPFIEVTIRDGLSTTMN